MTAPRQVVPGRYYAIDRRITQRLFLLRPEAEVNKIFDYCLAEAASRFGIGLIAWLAMSNHYHAVVYDETGRLPEFLEQFHKMTARALNAHWKRGENLWNTNQTSVVHLATPDAVLEKVIYLLANPMKANLVEKLVDWPGASSLFHHLDGRETKTKRPTKFFRLDGMMPESVTLTTFIPLFSESAERWRASVRAGIEEAEARYKATRAQEGKRVLGRAAVLRTSPLASPGLPSRTPSHQSKLRPLFATRDANARKAEIERIREFCRNYRSARHRFAAGERNVVFPFGTYLLKIRVGVTCAPPERLAA